MDLIKIAIVTTSDRASQGVYNDISGKAIIDLMKEYIQNEIEFEYKCIPDEKNLIKETLINLAKNNKM